MFKFNLATLLYTKLFTENVGQDEFGNQYYLSKFKNFKGQNKRSVIYKGIAEPSKIPPMWHAWIHFLTNDVPNSDYRKYRWNKTHKPNLTGTQGAYYPPGHPLAEGKRKKAIGDYQAWNPHN